MMPRKIFTLEERRRHRRCEYCEHHVPTQDHHPDCDRPQAVRDAR